MNTKVNEVENKVLDTNDLVTTTVLNEKISEVDKKFLIMINILLLLNLIS